MAALNESEVAWSDINTDGDGPYAAHKEYKTNENLVQPTPTTSTNNNWIKLDDTETNSMSNNCDEYIQWLKERAYYDVADTRRAEFDENNAEMGEDMRESLDNKLPRKISVPTQLMVNEYDIRQVKLHLFETQCELERKENEVLRLELMVSLLNQQLSKEWSPNECTDFKFVVEGIEFNIHKAVYLEQSVKFARMFANAKNNVAAIIGVSATDFKEFSRFMYTSKVEVTDENVCNLILLSQAYRIEALVDACETFISDQLSERNANKMFLIIEKYKLNPFLRMKAFRYMQRSIHNIRINIPDETFNDPAELRNIMKAMTQLKKRIAKYM